MLKNLYKSRGLLRLIALLGFALFLSHPHRSFAETPPVRTESLVLAGGCFWGVQSVFQHTKGVISATSGYAGGQSTTARYELVRSGTTGHAEAVKIDYDPQKITLSQLLDVYFMVAHDPTELNYQGPDHGTQYRSAIFYQTPEQNKVATEKIAELTADKRFSNSIVTT